jgi:plastocyanin
MRRRGGLVIGVLVGVLSLAAAGCGGDDEGGGSASATTAAPETSSAPETTAAAGGAGGENEFQLAASDFKWDQTSLEMQAGTEVKVEVSNQGQATHSFTFEEASADQDIAAGEDATITFTAPTAGSYQFLCKYHPTAMKGSVTVT